MEIETGIISKKNSLEIEMKKSSLGYHSILDCFNSTGIVPNGELGTIIGPRGNGKSVLIKTIITELAKQEVKTLVILSEEKTLNYKTPVSEIFYKLYPEKTLAEKKLGNTFFSSMLDWTEEHRNLKSFLAFIENQVVDRGVEFVIFDNFTTSYLGRLKIETQGYALEKIRELASYHCVSFLGVFHTAKGVNPYQKIIDGEDVRGNATSTNIASYNYVLTTLFKCQPPRAFLHIDKARYHEKANKTFWELRYEPNLKIYVQDKKVSSSLIEAIILELRKAPKNLSIERTWYE